VKIEAPWVKELNGEKRTDVVRWELQPGEAGQPMRLWLKLTDSNLQYPLVIDPSWRATGNLIDARIFHTATLLLDGRVLVAGGLDGSGVTNKAELYNPTTGAWSATGTLVTARQNYTATLLPNGKVLVVGGRNGGILASAELFDPTGNGGVGQWTATASLVTARESHTATLLPNGKVLVVGGFNGSYPNSAELYDPETSIWSEAGSLSIGRSIHTATLLSNGKVLVAGGGTNGPNLTSAEIYDPATGIWSVTGSLTTGRNAHTATLLPNGKVLVVGGYDGSYLNSAELYDPVTGMWSATASLATSRSDHTATLLPNGKVLVILGRNSGYLDSAELYDSETSKWSAVGNLNSARSDHTATLLPGGKVLVAGGRSLGVSLNSTELYDLTIGMWSVTGSLTERGNGGTPTLLSNGKVLAVGGYDQSFYLNSAELYDPVTGMWSVTGSLTTTRSLHTTTRLPNGKVLVVGGFNGTTLNSAEVYDPATGMWSATSSLTTARSDHTATLLANGKVLVVAGMDFSGAYLKSAELYDPATGLWSVTGSLATSRIDHTATLLSHDKVLVTGGEDHYLGNILNSAELYDPVTGQWSVTASLATSRYLHTATLLPNGKVLVAGGLDGNNSINSAELFDPAGNGGVGQWTATGSLLTGRSIHPATLLPSGKVLVAGGLTIGNDYTSSAELYDPATGMWSTTDNLHIARSAEAILLSNGKVMLVGGGTTVELYDPLARSFSGSFSNTGILATGRTGHTATLLPDGKVLVAAGNNGGALASAELYNQTSGTWSTTGALATARSFGHSATLLLNGKILVVGGNNGGALASAELFDPAGNGGFGQWTATASLLMARSGHTATLLPNGKVLVAGGSDSNFSSITSAELYDPVTHTWSATLPSQVGHSGHTATLLTSGKVLVAGGSSNIGELYDPSTKTWSYTGLLINGNRKDHTATLLPNGKVLLAGGSNTNGNTLKSVEIFNPVTGSWVSASDMLFARFAHRATLLPNGTVLVSGGANFTSQSGSEIYDPSTGTWKATGHLTTARYSHSATLLLDGRVLMAGGTNDNALASAEIYDVGLGFQTAWQPVISSVTSPLLPDAPLVVTGTQFAGISEASGGGSNSSATNYPVVQLMSLVNEQSLILPLDTSVGWSDTSFTSSALTHMTVASAGFPVGHARVTVFTNGIPALSKVIAIYPPTNLTIDDVTLNEGNTGTVPSTFTVGISAPAGTGGVSFDIATADDSAMAPGDYTVIPLTRQTIPEGSQSYTFTVLVNGDPLPEPDESFFVNVTNVTGATLVDGQGQGNIVNDDASADLAVTISGTPDPVIANNTLTYTITATNSGPDTATNASLSADLPTGTTFVSLTEPSGWSCTKPTVGAAGTVTCTHASLEIGSTTFSLVVKVDSDVTLGTVLSTTATIGSSTYDTVSGNNSAEATTTVAAVADLTIAKTDGVTGYSPGGTLVYTITASNAGPSDAPGATVTDILPAALTGTWTGVGAGGGVCSASGSGNINDTVNLPVGASVTYTLTVTVATSAVGDLTNTASVSPGSGIADPTPEDNEASDTDVQASIYNPVVMSLADNGPGSLRQAIADAGLGNTISFSNNSDPGAVNFNDGTPRTITLTTGQLLVEKNLTISGPGAHLLTISGNDASRVFQVPSAAGSVDFALSGLTIAHGNATDASPGGAVGGGIFYFRPGIMTIADCIITTNSATSSGGGLFNASGTLTITNSTISGNTVTNLSATGSSRGGGITNNRGLTIMNSTVSGNSVTSPRYSAGGGIYTDTGVLVNITNSTISGNAASETGGAFGASGGGIHCSVSNNVNLTNVTIAANSATGLNSAGGGIITYAEVNVRNSIIAGNTAPDAPDFSRKLNSLGYNLIGDTSGTTMAGDTTGNILNVTAQLGALADNGGPTSTIALLSDSPAINTGDPAFTESPEFDQRGAGFPRVVGTRVDIGAYEFAPPTAIEIWRQTNFGDPANSGNGADTFDLDKDGLANLVEYAFGLDPMVDSSMQLPAAQYSGGNFFYDFTETPGISEVTFHAYWSTTLEPTDWHIIPDTGTPPQHLFSVPEGDNDRLFLRIGITNP
jgi:uncharacterized repeat protein (TIGR01451 family)